MSKDLKSLLAKLQNTKQRKDTEYRINGDSKKYRKLNQQYYDLLRQVGDATE